MAGKPAIEIEGSRELRRAIKKMDDRLEDLKAANRAAADDVVDTARSIVPIRSGTLQRSIRGSAGKTRASILAGKGSVPYAAVIHFGWPKRNIEPQPFLYDALDRRRDEVAAAYEKNIAALVAKLDKEAP